MRFVTTDVKRIHLKDGADGEKNWIEVKLELTAGEDKRYKTAGMTRLRPDAAPKGKDGKPEERPDDASVSVEVDWERMSFARAETYLTDWSSKRRLSRSSLEALDKDDFEEIDEAIKAHIAEMEEAKKKQAGSTQPTSK